MKIYLLKAEDYVAVSINHLGSHCFPHSVKKMEETKKTTQGKIMSVLNE